MNASRTGFHLLIAIYVLVGPSIGLSVGPSVDLKADHLTEAGLHLPPYMSTIADVNRYQEQLALHQELLIEWDSMPGQSEKRPLEQVPLESLAPNFTILKRKRMLDGSAGKSRSSISHDSIVIVAITANKEVRGLKLEGDPRMIHSEDIENRKRWDFVYPKATILTYLPDDPQAKFLVFYKAEMNRNNDGGWHLREVGRVLLPK